MRFRAGLLIGLGVGYYYGARAGRERFELMDEWLDRVRATTTYRDLTIKVGDGVREGTTAVRRAVETTVFRAVPPTEEYPFVVHDDTTDPIDLRSLFDDPTLN